MNRALLRPVTALATAGLLVGVAACSSDEDSAPESTEKSGGSVSRVSDDPSEMTLTDSDTPAGWEWNDATEVFDDGDDDAIAEYLDAAKDIETDPEQCAALDPSTLPSLAMLHKYPDSTAGVGFLPQDETDSGVINSVISTEPDETGMTLPEDLSECSTFTTTSGDGGEEVTYRADASEAEVLGAEDVQVITLVSDAEVQSGDDTVSLVVGTVDGVAFRLDASGLKEPNMLLDLVDRQVDRIIGNDPDDK